MTLEQLIEKYENKVKYYDKFLKVWIQERENENTKYTQEEINDYVKYNASQSVIMAEVLEDLKKVKGE